MVPFVIPKSIVSRLTPPDKQGTCKSRTTKATTIKTTTHIRCEPNFVTFHFYYSRLCFSIRTRLPDGFVSCREFPGTHHPECSLCGRHCQCRCVHGFFTFSGRGVVFDGVSQIRGSLLLRCNLQTRENTACMTCMVRVLYYSFPVFIFFFLSFQICPLPGVWSQGNRPGREITVDRRKTSSLLQ